MNFTDAVRAAVAGKKIRRVGWDASVCLLVYTQADGNTYLDFEGDDDTSANLSTTSYLADDWEVIEDPPKTMTFSAMQKVYQTGRSVKRLGSDKVHSLQGGVLFHKPSNDYWFMEGFNGDDIEAMDWVVVEEEGKKG
jgi:hypothetical protein